MSDAKVQVSYDCNTSRVTTFLVSPQHQEDISVMDIRLLVEAIMETAGKIRTIICPIRISTNSSLPKYLSNFPYFTGFSAHSLVK